MNKFMASSFLSYPTRSPILILLKKIEYSDGELETGKDEVRLRFCL